MSELKLNLPKNGFCILFCLLLSFLIINPLFLTTEVGNIILQTFVSVILLAILYLLVRNKYVLYFIAPLILIAILVGWYNFFDYSLSRQILVYSLKMIALGASIIVIAIFVAKHRVVDLNIIVGALTLYILMALLWALMYTMIELQIPHSFHGELLNPGDESPLDKANSIFTNMVYFSVTTITTLGFGDISPTNIYSRSLVILETLFGVFYFGAIISTLIAIRFEQVKNGE